MYAGTVPAGFGNVSGNGHQPANFVKIECVLVMEMEDKVQK